MNLVPEWKPPNSPTPTWTTSPAVSPSPPGLDAGAAVVLGHGSVGVGVCAEVGPLSVSAGLGGSVSHAGAVRTTMV